MSHWLNMRFTWVAALVVCAGCSDNLQQTPPLGGSLTVKGTVLDFETSQPVAAEPMIETSGLNPPPHIVTTGAMFTLTGIPEISAFQVKATLAPDYAPTYSPTILAVKADVTGAKAYAVKTTFVQTLQTGFGVTADASTGILLMHLVGPDGTPKQNVAASNLIVNGASAPHFLDATLHPSTATTSSSSGWAVFFGVPAGTAQLGQAANQTVTLAMDAEPIDAATVTIAEVTVTDGAPPSLPTNVSFSNQIVPIFTSRGCVGCHSGNGPGKDLGGLQLDGGVPKIYSELTVENPLRVNTTTPEKSLVLTMPSAESPPDAHPNVTFTGPTDPDYEKLLVWIREGAKNN